MKHILIALLALTPIACGEGQSISTVLPSPTALITAANATCDTQITSLTIDVNYAGPYFEIDLKSAAATESLEIEIEEYLPDGQTELVARLTNIVGRTRVDVHFNTKYRARARGGSCTWSPWVDREVGPANPCGDCRATPPPPPADDDDEEDDCVVDDQPWNPLRQRMTGPPPCEATPD